MQADELCQTSLTANLDIILLNAVQVMPAHFLLTQMTSQAAQKVQQQHVAAAAAGPGLLLQWLQQSAPGSRLQLPVVLLVAGAARSA
jgi:hypothetical protein